MVMLSCVFSLACTSSSQNVTGPSTSRCQVSAAADPATFGAGGGRGTLTVTINRECTWSAASADTWLQLGTEASGQGNATVTFTVNTNANPSQRRGVITIGEHHVPISQDAAACAFTVPSRDTVSADGERRTLSVTANGSACSWTARSETEWLTILQGGQGSGSGQVVYEARRTSGPIRSGELTIAGHRVAVTQGGGCSVAVAPTSQSVGAEGGSGEIAVTTAAACPWSAQSDAGWISITSPTSGTGPATLAFRVGPWDGPPRTGTLRIDQQVFTVTQSNGCRFSISPDSHAAASTGGAATVALTTAAGCEWTAASSAPWIAITGGRNESGSGTVQFTVAANTGPARSGTLAIAGRTFGISQSSGCSFSISPESHSVAHTGGSGTVAVTAAAECGWTATSSAPWITIASGGSGNGNGTVQFAVAPTTGPARSGTLTIAGRTFVVSQSSGCSFSISPTSQAAAYSGGPGSIAVSTSPGCTWTAASSTPWVHITAGASGADAGTVMFTTTETPSSLPRSGSLSVAGHTFVVTQEGAPCAFVLSPPSASLGAGGGAGSFEVNTKEACAWTARSNEPWLHVTAGGSGSGDGTLSFSADPNPGPARTGTIAVGGLTFTASQAGAAAILAISVVDAAHNAAPASRGRRIQTAPLLDQVMHGTSARFGRHPGEWRRNPIRN